MKLFEMFAGYGGASFALKKAGIDFECVGYSEIDKFAIKCYEQNHANTRLEKHYEISEYGNIPEELIFEQIYNHGDCIKIDPKELPDFDLLTGGFPCQAFSAAGKGLGELDTRGTLFHEIIRIAEVKKPKWLLLENVKGLTFKKHKKTFEKIISELERIGYSVQWKILNSKDYGIPQNRERIFFVCYNIESCTDDGFDYFEWPEKEKLTLFLKDILEDEVDEKYYLKEEQVNKLLIDMPKTSYYIDANYHKGTNVKQYLEKKRRQIIPVLTPDRINKRQNGRRFKTDGEPMFTLNTQDKHGILQLDVSQLRREGKPRVYENISKTLNTAQGGGHTPLVFKIKELKIRKLTPKECFRLMGFLDDSINLEGLSNTQRYKLAGNGWDINLVSKIFKKMFKRASKKKLGEVYD